LITAQEHTPQLFINNLFCFFHIAEYKKSSMAFSL
jgi:hypothetical protein